MGKSFLCRKIGADWAEGRLPRTFAFVFVVRLDQISTQQTIPEAIMDQCKYLSEENITVDQIEKRLKSPDTLLVLDGFDELKTTGEVLCIISGRKYRKCGWILTSRRHSALSVAHYAQARVTLEGFTRDQLFKYLTHQLEGQSEAGSFEDLIADNDLDDLLKVPLFAALLCEIYKHRKITAFPHSTKELLDQFMNSLEIYVLNKGCSAKQFQEAKALLANFACQALSRQFVRCRKEQMHVIEPLNSLVPGQSYGTHFTFVKFSHEVFKYYFAAAFISERVTPDDTSLLDDILSLNFGRTEQFLDASLFFGLLVAFRNSPVTSRVFEVLGQLYHDKDYGISAPSTFLNDSRVYFNDDSGCDDYHIDLNEVAFKLVSLNVKHHQADLCALLPLCHNLYRECSDQKSVFSDRALCNAALYAVDLDNELDSQELPAQDIRFVPRNILLRNFELDSSVALPDIISSQPVKSFTSLRVLDSTWNSGFCRDLSSWIRKYCVRLDRVSLVGVSVELHSNAEDSRWCHSQGAQKLATALIQPELELLVLTSLQFHPILWEHVVDRLQVC